MMALTELQSTQSQLPIRVRHAAAWVALCLALAVHVVDEALTDFLSVYNPAVRAIRDQFPWLPLPVFTFEIWLGSLILAVIALSSMTTLVLSGARWMTTVSYAFGALMFVNGLLHIGVSLEMGKLMPGSYSAPLLVGTSGYLLASVYQQRRRMDREFDRP